MNNLINTIPTANILTYGRAENYTHEENQVKSFKNNIKKQL